MTHRIKCPKCGVEVVLESWDIMALKFESAIPLACRGCGVRFDVVLSAVLHETETTP